MNRVERVLKTILNFRGAVLDKGAIYVVVILTLLIFGGYILVGGTLPTKLPNVNTNIVNLIPISVEPSKTSLQMFTFYGVTPTPYPTLPPLPTSSNSDPTLIDCNRDITGNQLSQMIWGFSFDQPPTAASENQPAFKAFYTSRNSLVLGSGVVSPMNQNPSGNTINPAIGDTTAKDTNNFVYYPSTFITDITGAANDASGDSQAGGIPNKPDYIYGTWKALGAVDPGANGLTLGTNEDALPAANGPPGDHNQTYSSEIVWKIANLKTKDNASLIPGHKYRIQIALHDGATPTNIGVACVQLNLPGGDNNVPAGNLCTGITPSSPEVPIKSVGWWESLFQGTWPAELSTYTPKSTSNDSWDNYDLAYAFNANYMMFKATGKTMYLDRALTYIENKIAAAQVSSSIPTSQFKDSYLTWANHGAPPNDGQEYPLYESYGWRYVTAILYAMKQDPAVFNDPNYKAKYDNILAFTEKNIWEKWYTRGVANLYRANTHMASHWAMIGMYLSLLTTDSAKKAQYETVWKNIALNGIPIYSSASLKAQLRPNPVDSTAYWWNWDWNVFSQPGSDVSHGNAVASFMVESNCLGLAWTPDDMQKMANLVKNVIIPRSPGFLDGSGSDPAWLNDGYAQLGRYDKALQVKVENSTVGRNSTLYGAGALNAKILGAPN